MRLDRDKSGGDYICVRVWDTHWKWNGCWTVAAGMLINKKTGNKERLMKVWSFNNDDFGSIDYRRII